MAVIRLSAPRSVRTELLGHASRLNNGGSRWISHRCPLEDGEACLIMWRQGADTFLLSHRACRALDNEANRRQATSALEANHRLRSVGEAVGFVTSAALRHQEREKIE